MDDRILIGGFALLALILAYSCSCIWNAIFYLGLIRLLMFYSSLAHFINKFFIRGRLDLIKRYGKSSYALITGSSNGIGLEYALQLAETGFNLILVDKDSASLEKTKSKILEKFPNAKIEIIPCNLCEMTKPENYEQFLNSIDHLDISILINNAEMIDFHEFHETKPENISKVIHINAVAVLGFCKLFYTRLLKREKQSAIVNMSSGVGLTSNKLLSVYPSTKAFVKYLTEGLKEESKGKMDLLYVYPGIVTTNSSAFKVSPGSTTPDVIVENVLNSLGQDGYTAGYWLHDVILSLIEALFYGNREAYRYVEDMIIEKTGIEKDLRKHAQEFDKKNK